MDKGKGIVVDADFPLTFEDVKNCFLTPQNHPLFSSNGTSEGKLPFQSSHLGHGFNPNPSPCLPNLSQTESVSHNLVPSYGAIGNKTSGYGTISSMLKSTPRVVNQVPLLNLKNINLASDVINPMLISAPPPLGLNLPLDGVNTILNKLNSKSINGPLSSNQEEFTNRIPFSIWTDQPHSTSSLVGYVPSFMAPGNQLLPPFQVHGKQAFPPPPPNVATQAAQSRIKKRPAAVLEVTGQMNQSWLKRISINRETDIIAKEKNNPYMSSLEVKHQQMLAHSSKLCAQAAQMKSDTVKLDASNYTIRERWINDKEQIELQNSMKKGPMYMRENVSLGNQPLLANVVSSSSRYRNPLMPDVSALPHFSRFQIPNQQWHHHLSYIQQFPERQAEIQWDQQSGAVQQSRHHEAQTPSDQQLPGLLDFQSGIEQEQSLIKELRQCPRGQAQTPSKQQTADLEMEEITGLLEFQSDFDEEQSFWDQQLKPF